MKRAAQILTIFLLAFACDNDEQNEPNQNTSEPFPTEVGLPIGSVISKEIGSSGGSLSSDDGMLDIIVPPGAVTTNTLFSVQAITNFCPGGKNAYRLLPEGPNFINPVKLVFHYTQEDMAETSADLMGIAYQAPDNIWYTLSKAEVDEVNKTISVEVKHFTDWTAIEYLGIFPKIPELPELRVNETIELSIYGQGMATEEDDLPPLPRNPNPTNNPSPGEDDLPPLPVPRPFQAKWFVNGVETGNDRVGRISPGNAVSHTVIYKAPSTTPIDDIVLVSAEITGLKKWTIEGGKPTVKKHNKVILFKRIKIKPDEYNYTLKIDHKDDFACGYEGQVIHDGAVMDVRVKGGTVTIQNIVNQAPIVTPLTINIFNCSLTCDYGEIGFINVISGSGSVLEQRDENDNWQFEIILEHKSAVTGGAATLVCENAPPIVGELGTGGDQTEHFTFILTADSVQKQGTPPERNFGHFISLTPK